MHQQRSGGGVEGANGQPPRGWSGPIPPAPPGSGSARGKGGRRGKGVRQSNSPGEARRVQEEADHEADVRAATVILP